MQTPIAYTPSPWHQGSRNRTGNQVDREFTAALLSTLGDCRLLWLPNLTDAATSADKSRYGRTLTWSESLVTFDTKRARLGAGVTVTFNGTDETGAAPDADDFSFGDGVNDAPFSIVALVRPNGTAASKVVLSKFDGTTGSTKREWRLLVDDLERPILEINDESAGASLARYHSAGLSTAAFSLITGTYDGTRAAVGLRVYVNGARVDDTTSTSGTYAALENTGSTVRVAFRQGAAAAIEHFAGAVGLVALTAKALTADEVWHVKTLVNAYFNLSL